MSCSSSPEDVFGVVFVVDVFGEVSGVGSAPSSWGMVSLVVISAIFCIACCLAARGGRIGCWEVGWGGGV
jgi:hypothetical protein